MSVSAAGYLRIASTDTAAWMDFGTTVLGLMDAQIADAAGAQFLRMDDHPFRFMIESGDTDKLIATGLEYPSEAAWQTTLDELTGAGHAVVLGSAEEAQRRYVTAFATVQDPADNTLELYWGRKLDYVPLVSPAGVSGFVTTYQQTGDMGFGHCVLPAPDIEGDHSVLHAVYWDRTYRHAVSAWNGRTENQLYACQQPAPTFRCPAQWSASSGCRAHHGGGRDYG